MIFYYRSCEMVSLSLLARSFFPARLINSELYHTDARSLFCCLTVSIVEYSPCSYFNKSENNSVYTEVPLFFRQNTRDIQFLSVSVSHMPQCPICLSVPYVSVPHMSQCPICLSAPYVSVPHMSHCPICLSVPYVSQVLTAINSISAPSIN